MDREQEVHTWLVRSVYVLGVVTFLVTSKIVAPFGRHVRGGWGPTVPNRVGWIVMEAPSCLLFAYIFFNGQRWQMTTAMAGAACWIIHYFYRAFVYPFLIRSNASKRMPVVVMLSAITYNVLNSYINARYLSEFNQERQPYSRWSFWSGGLLFIAGFCINVQSDQILIALGKQGAAAVTYKIPFGGFFDYVSCANYFGELVEWIGWAMLTASPAGWSFAFYTASNLVPRAISHHEWYLNKFKDTYPRDRKAIIPGLL